MKKKILFIIILCLLSLGVYAKNNSTLRIPFTLSEDGYIVLDFSHSKEIFQLEFSLVTENSQFYKVAIPKITKSYFDDDRDLKEIIVEIFMNQENVDYAEAEKIVSEELKNNGLHINPDLSIDNITFSNRDFFVQFDWSANNLTDGCIGLPFFTNVENIFIDYKESYIEINSKIKGKNSILLYNMPDTDFYSDLKLAYIIAELNGIQQPFIITCLPVSSARKDINSSYIYKGEEFWNIVNDSTEINLEYNTDFEAEITVGNVSDKINIIKYSDDKISTNELSGRKIFQLYNSLGNDFFKDKRILVDYMHKKFYIW